MHDKALPVMKKLSVGEASLMFNGELKESGE